MPSRITYNSINIDLVREWNRFSVRNAVNNASVQSMAGVQQTAHFFDQDFITAERERLTAQEVIELKQFYDFAKDGSTFSFERDRNLGTYISFEGKSLNTNDGTAGTFTRALTTDSSYYLDPSTGLMTVLNTVDLPRFPAGKYGGGVLIEGARTNLNDRPGDFLPATSTWIDSTLTTTADTTETLSIKNDNLADKIVTTTPTFGTKTFTTSTAISTDDASFQLIVKVPSGTETITLRIEGTSGGTDSSGAIVINASGIATAGSNSINLSLGNGWVLISHRHNNDASLTGNWRFVIVYAHPGTFYCDVANFEVGADVLFPSQPIGAVSTSSVTRNTEQLTYSTTDIINQNKFTVSFWIKPEWKQTEHNNPILFQDSNDGGSANQHIHLFMNTGNLRFITRSNNDGTTGADISWNATTLTQNTNHHIVITGDATASNSNLIYFDGVLKATSINDPYNISNIGSSFAIGSAVGGSSPAFAVIDDVMIKKDVFNAAQVRSLFNFGRGLGIRKNRWSSVKLKNPDFNPIPEVGNKYSFRLELEEVLS